MKVGALGALALTSVPRLDGWWDGQHVRVVHGPGSATLRLVPGSTLSLFALHGPCLRVTLSGARWGLDKFDPEPLVRGYARWRDAEQVDVGEHLFFDTGGNGQHGDHGADAEDHAEHGEHRSQLVRAQVVEALVHLGREVEDGGAGPAHGGCRAGHRTGPPAGADPAPEEAVAADVSGFTRATSVPSSTPSTATRLSVRWVIFTSRAANPDPVLA